MRIKMLLITFACLVLVGTVLSQEVTPLPGQTIYFSAWNPEKYESITGYTPDLIVREGFEWDFQYLYRLNPDGTIDDLNIPLWGAYWDVTPDCRTLVYNPMMDEELSTSDPHLQEGDVYHRFAARDLESGETTVLNLPGERETPSFLYKMSPDGNRVATIVALGDSGDGTGYYHLTVWTQEEAGWTANNVLTTIAYIDDYHWTPDGKAIAVGLWTSFEQEDILHLLIEVPSGAATGISQEEFEQYTDGDRYLRLAIEGFTLIGQAVLCNS